MTHKGVKYFATWEQAVEVRASLLERFPEAREVEYERGIAVQYYRSGPYYPELEEKDGCEWRQCPQCRGARVVVEWKGTASEAERTCGYCDGGGKVLVRLAKTKDER